MPKEEVSYLLIGQGPLQQEGGQVTVQVGLVLQHLHQLDQVLQQLVVTVDPRFQNVLILVLRPFIVQLGTPRYCI